MVKYILKRFVLAFVTIFFVVSLLYVAMSYTMISQWNFDDNVSEWDCFKRALTYLKPYWKGILTEGYFGKVKGTDITVVDFYKPLIPFTLATNLFALLIYVPLGLLLGVLSALFKDSIFDKLWNVISLVLGSIPIYISIQLLYWWVGYRWGILPYSFPLRNPGLWNSGIYFIIPAISLSTLPISRISRAIRSELVSTFEEDYLLLARTKGFTHRQALMRHSFKNVIIPVLPQIFNVFYIVLNWSFLVEIVYRIPGSGKVLYDSLIQFYDEFAAYIDIDVPTVTYVGALYVLISIAFGFVIDVVNVLIDPRITYVKKR